MAEASMTSGMDYGELNRWLAARRAAGLSVNPAELRALAEGSILAKAKAQQAGRGLSLQAARDAETARMNIVNTGLRQDEIAAGKRASNANALTYGGVAGLGLLLQRDKSGNTNASDLWNWGKKKWGTGDAVNAGTSSGAFEQPAGTSNIERYDQPVVSTAPSGGGSSTGQSNQNYSGGWQPSYIDWSGNSQGGYIPDSSSDTRGLNIVMPAEDRPDLGYTNWLNSLFDF